MKVRMLFFILFLLLLSSCKTKEAKQMEALMNELGINFTCPSDSNVIVIIPTNGCASCIQGALNDVRESCDTAFVLLGTSKKEFSLLYKGKKLPTYNNVYLAKNIMSLASDLMLTYPVAYLLKEGKYVSMTPYESLKKPRIVYMPNTEVYVNKQKIDLGNISMDKIYTDSINITNSGQIDLQIIDIESSCECTQVKFAKHLLAPSETMKLHIAFQPEEKGYFERYVSIHCNVSNSPIEILISGRVK